MCKEKDEYRVKITAFGTMYIEPKDIVHSQSFKNTINDIIKLFEKKEERKESVAHPTESAATAVS